MIICTYYYICCQIIVTHELILKYKPNRRDQVLARENGLQDTREERFAMKRIMRDQHKQAILGQLERDKQRHFSEVEKVERAREAKKQINTQIRVRIEGNQVRCS